MSPTTTLVISLARGPLIGTFLGLMQVPLPRPSRSPVSHQERHSLYGVTCMQAFFYFRTYEHDTLGLKMTVCHAVGTYPGPLVDLDPPLGGIPSVGAASALARIIIHSTHTVSLQRP